MKTQEVIALIERTLNPKEKKDMNTIVTLIALKYRKNGEIKTKFYNTKKESMQMREKLRMHKLKFLGCYPVEAIIKA